METDSGMMRIVCVCGKRLKVLPQHAGRKVKCTECGTILVVPGPTIQSMNSGPPPIWGPPPLPSGTLGVPASVAPMAPGFPPSGAGNGSTRIVIAAVLTTAAVFVMMIVGGVILFSLHHSPPPTSTRQTHTDLPPAPEPVQPARPATPAKMPAPAPSPPVVPAPAPNPPVVPAPAPNTRMPEPPRPKSEEAISWVPGRRMVEAVARVMGAARRVSNQTSYGYDDDISVLAAFLSTGRQVSFNRTLRGGVKYVILGGGDQAVHDLDICVLDSNGRIIASDTAADPSPVVQFQAPITGTYTIRQTLFQGEERRGGFCVVAILREGGYDVPVANLSSAVGSLIEQCVSLDTRTKRRVSFHAEANQWAVMGGVLKQGEEITITSVALGVGDRMILAGGDSTTQDIDLYLLNSQGNRVLKDEDDDATPQLLFRSTGVGTNGLCIKNTRSRGPSLILAAFLALE